MVKYNAIIKGPSGLRGPNRLLRLIHNPLENGVLHLATITTAGSRVDFVMTGSTDTGNDEVVVDFDNSPIWRVACKGTSVSPTTGIRSGVYVTTNAEGFGVKAVPGNIVFGYAIDSLLNDGDTINIARCGPFTMV